MAQQLLGSALYQQANARGQVDPEATLWMRKAAEAGNSEAQFVYGLFLAVGTGVDKDLPQAIDLWRQAAASGQTGARCILSVVDSSDAEGQDASVVASLKSVGSLLRNATDPECEKWGVYITVNVSPGEG